MYDPFITHLFKKIGEGKRKKESSLSAIEATRKRVESVAETISQRGGKDTIQNTLWYKEVIRALNQCQDYLENSNTQVTEEDHTIYYTFLHNRLSEAERIIDSEFPDYKL